MPTNSVSLSNLTIRGTVVPLGGEGVFAEAEIDPRATESRGITQSTYNYDPNRTATIRVSVYANDAAAPVLQGLVNADDAAAGTLVDSGSMTTSNGETLTWGDGKCTQEGAVRIEREAQIKVYEFRVSKVVSIHGAA